MNPLIARTLFESPNGLHSALYYLKRLFFKSTLFMLFLKGKVTSLLLTTCFNITKEQKILKSTNEERGYQKLS